MEELIIKYLTDTLTPDEDARLRAMKSSDTSFVSEAKACLTALALTDYSLRDAEKNDDLTYKLQELING